MSEQDKGQDGASKASAKKGAAKKSAADKSAAKKSPAKKSSATKGADTSVDPTKPAIKLGAEPAPVIEIGEGQGNLERQGTGRLTHKTRDERIADGLMARTRVSPRSLGLYAPGANRTNPVELIVSQESTRLTPLLGLRHARMAASPFAFYRGTAILMAQDLGANASPLIAAQIGGDAHMSNFGFYAGEDRRLVFDMNDFDETRPGPFEWDTKRYCTSVLLAARANNIPADLAERAVLIFARRYMWWIREFANRPSLEVWYDRLDVQNWVESVANASLDELENLIAYLEGVSGVDDSVLSEAAKAAAAARLAKDVNAKTKNASGKKAKGKPEKQARATAADLRDLYVQAGKTVLKKASKKTGAQAVASLTTVDANGGRIFIDNPPLVERLSGRAASEFGTPGDAMVDMLRSVFRQYRASMSEEKRVLIDRYAYRDGALKVVGVGSVGTRAAILLMEGQGARDPFILQIKEANQSVLTPYISADFKASHLPNPKEMGKRVVLGQRLMQATSDIFLGWVSNITGPAGYTTDYYIRQLKDMKYSFDVENLDVAMLIVNAILVARVLAHAHARSGDPLTMAAYMGDNDDFAQGLLDFSRRYVDQVDSDYAEFMDAIAAGHIEVAPSVDG